MFSYKKLKVTPASAFLVINALLFVSTSTAETFYVDHKFRGENPEGLSWSSAFSTVQGAINAASDAGGGDVWVKAGVHKSDGLSRSSTIELKPNVALYGGFRGNETQMDQRNVKANRTILSGEFGRVGATSDNSFHVLTGASHSRIDGFIITRGNANSAAEHRFGGGLLFPPDSSGAVIANCTFEKNYAESGGAIHIRSSNILVTNCTFYSNSAESGGAIASTGRSELKILDSIFSSNFAAVTGGSIVLTVEAKAILEKTSFLYNATDGKGGAISARSELKNGMELTIKECGFSENSATKGGGAIFLSGAYNPQIVACTFDRNFSTHGAGALSNVGGIVALVSDTTFSGNRGTKGNENIQNDETSIVASTLEEATKLTHRSKDPNSANRTPKTQVAEKPEPAPKPKRKLGDEFVHNAQGTKIKLSSIVADSEYTVLVLGDLTDPNFISHYRKIETTALDYRPKGIQFYYIYRYLLHPENNGYLQPFNLKERGQQIILAREQLSTGIPWLCDVMDNQAAKALSPNSVESVFIFDAGSTEVYAGPMSNDTEFRQALVNLAGQVELPTPIDTLAKPKIEPIHALETKLVTRIKVSPKSDQFLPLQLTPLESNQPHYVKVRVEGNEELRETGDGQLYLGFHIDPLYKSEWNNLGDPMRYAIKAPGGVVAPSINQAPRITSKATDSEPREFLLIARKLDLNKPLALQVTYTVYSPKSKRNIEVSQQYFIYLKEDPFGGKVFGRQNTGKVKKVNTPSFAGGNAFTTLLRRYDLDRNGKLTDDEVIGGIRSNFAEIDTNADGAIDEAEYMLYRENR
ncbi:MAG: hypothetical protein V3V05_01645 [Pontiella sp.]